MAYWGCAQLQPIRTAVALHHLALAGYEVYHPRLRQQRVSHGRRVLATPPLFPGYAFIHIVAQWYTARWAPGVVRLVLDGVQPARVPDTVISEIKSRERNGLIELIKPPLRRGARVKILHGPFRDHLAIFADMKPRERVEILLQILGGEQRVELARTDIEVISS
jgi:transcriptional antiterminator RfaH